MKKLVLVAVFVIGFSMVAVAQEGTASYEFFLGYSALRANYVQWEERQSTAGMVFPAGQNCIPNSTGGVICQNTPKNSSDLNGGIFSIALGKKNVAALIDFSGYTGYIGSGTFSHITVSYQYVHYPRQYKMTTASFGPKFSATMGKFSPFCHALFGMGHSRVGGNDYQIDKSGTSTKANPAPSALTANSFVFKTGGGLDINTEGKFGLRAFQAEFLAVRWIGWWLKDVTVSSGVTIRLGKRYS
jgi:hypothetical protein